MRVLLDTHTFLWWVDGDPLLSLIGREVLGDKANEVYFSTAASWEIAIKVSIGRLVLAGDLQERIADQLQINEFHLLPITLAHTCRVSLLPFHHRDPFDRLLIAQAQLEGLIILTRDPMFLQYEVQTFW
ncbi:MAG: type II toxin-antitoxin system VapC family toxin [Deltaproteobacteria bacterium]|nr:type II toxin-antitoxin system VapC family toxin [Deltaproteobacteria bacterium]